MNKYNLIDKNNIITPNYNIDNIEISFDIYVSSKQEVCIIGVLDNNYICWCSITSIEDKEINSSILNYILKYNLKVISNTSKALGSRYQEVMSWHKFHVVKSLYNNEYRFYSPVNNSFFRDGEFFESEISKFYDFELSKCKYRLIDNSYITILKQYKNILTQDNNCYYYLKMKPVISILQSESYIKLCPNEEIRNLYLDCIRECSNLYNRYMSAVR